MLNKIRNNKKGFTLAELLVVVAIIGVLVAISIPIFTAQLSKARKGTNQANVRSAKAAAVSAYLTATDAEKKAGVTVELNVKTGATLVTAGTAGGASAKTQIETIKNDDLTAIDSFSGSNVYNFVAVSVDGSTTPDTPTYKYFADAS